MDENDLVQQVEFFELRSGHKTSLTNSNFANFSSQKKKKSGTCVATCEMQGSR